MSGGPIAEQAVVIGAGMGGLTAAKAVSQYFEKVIVLDRDALPEGPAARPGTPQARHAHALLAGGLNALDELFPGFCVDLAQAGAVKVRSGLDVIWERPGYDPFPIRDLGFDSFSMSRPLLEWVCRRRLGETPNIELRSGCRVIRILPGPDNARVAGVEVEEDGGPRRRVTADCVVDASGRGGLTLAFFDAIGQPRPEETEIGIDMGYATAIFEIPERGPEWKGLSHVPRPPDEQRGGLILPLENQKWVVSIGERHGDKLPGELEGFLAFTKTFRTPTIYEAIRGAKPASDIVRYNLPASTRFHFEGLARSPRGLIPLGDAICRFNPIFGQGMSVAAQEALALRNLLEDGRVGDDPLSGLAERFFAEIQGCLASPWSTAVTDFVLPQTRGERPPDLENRLRYGAALLRLAAEDPEVHKLMAEVSSLLKPASALREPELARRITAVMSAAA